MTNKQKKYLADEIKKSRNEARLTQSEVAEASGISVNHYAKIERGEIVPGLETFLAIVKALDAESSDFLPY
jgi:transcriptional regulator with XRE-family HTH domain